MLFIYCNIWADYVIVWSRRLWTVTIITRICLSLWLLMNFINLFQINIGHVYIIIYVIRNMYTYLFNYLEDLYVLIFFVTNFLYTKSSD